MSQVDFACSCRTRTDDLSVGTGAGRLSAPGVSARRATRNRVRTCPVTRLPFADTRSSVGALLVLNPGGSRGAAGDFGCATNAAVALEVGDLQGEDGRYGLGCLSIMRSGS
jgi:hypothetical protein